MARANAWSCLTLSLLVLSPVLFVTFLFAVFPGSPESMVIHPSLSSLPQTHRSWAVYPPDTYPGGGYAPLPYGKTRYWLFGPEDGQKIVLLHGLSVPSLIWKNVAPDLARRGYRVLLYDLYGRGYTEAPQTTYTTTFYTTQLALLMQYLKWDKTYVAGMSMGGGITAAFVAQFPHLVEDRVVLIASAGLIGTNDMSRTTRLVSTPIMQAVVSSGPVRKYVQSLLQAHVSPERISDPIAEIVRIQSAHLPGFNQAVSSSLREGPIRGQAASFSTPEFNGRNILFIHGTNDTTVDYKYAKMMQDLLPENAASELLTVENAGHELLSTHPRIILEAMDYFFRDGKVGSITKTSQEKSKT
ncbi:Alpha/Beta hydrolase protein [Flagelloscypha sp. PMI_526]|nr:Alpha/Beta hydrolase protein [Flagelloscypha sp. PMI_526]